MFVRAFVSFVFVLCLCFVDCFCDCVRVCMCTMYKYPKCYLLRESPRKEMGPTTSGMYVSVRLCILACSESD